MVYKLNVLFLLDKEEATWFAEKLYKSIEWLNIANKKNPCICYVWHVWCEHLKA